MRSNMMMQTPSTHTPFSPPEAEVYVWKGAGEPLAWGHLGFPSFLHKKARTGSIYSPVPASAEPLADPLRIEVRMWEEAGAQAVNLIDAFLDGMDDDEDEDDASKA
jgi:hypothetical protein